MITRKEMANRFHAFKMATMELNDGWQLYNTGRFSKDYPLEGCFSEERIALVKWCETSEAWLKEITFEDMKKSRKLYKKDNFEKKMGIETDFEDCQFLFVYFDSFYIGINDNEFRVVICNSESYMSSLCDAERIMWEDFLKEEMNHG